MLLIAHRGNLSGPDSNKENSPTHIENAIGNGFGVEIDVRCINGEWWFGHDKPTYKVNINDWIELKNTKLFFHAKDIKTLFELISLRDESYNYFSKNNDIFYHDKDECTLTANNYIWTYPGKQLTRLSIAVMPEMTFNWSNLNKCYGICSDYPYKYKELYNI